MSWNDTTIKPGKTFRLDDFDPNDQGTYKGKEDPEAAEDLAELQKGLAEYQERLYAEGKQSLLIVLQAMDAAGKDGTIKHVMGAFNPQGVHVVAFKGPTEEELAHDFLWRIHAHTPRNGMIAVFNRSHYEDVLVTRVRKLVPAKVWKDRFSQINAFEKILSDHGTRLVKIFLHIDKAEQKKRLVERQKIQAKHFKFNPSDLADRRLWDEFQEAYEDALTRCNTIFAPWHIVPANRKWYRNIVVSRLLLDALKQMDPAYPPAVKNIEDYTIPD